MFCSIRKQKTPGNVQHRLHFGLGPTAIVQIFQDRKIGRQAGVDMLSVNAGTVASWKRFAITILKNDHTCKYMGLAPTKEQAVRQRQIMEKYKNI